MVSYVSCYFFVKISINTKIEYNLVNMVFISPVIIHYFSRKMDCKNASFSDKLQYVCQVCDNRIVKFTLFCKEHPDWFTADEKAEVRKSIRRNQSYANNTRLRTIHRLKTFKMPVLTNEIWSDIDFVPDFIDQQALVLTEEELAQAFATLVQDVCQDAEFD